MKLVYLRRFHSNFMDFEEKPEMGLPSHKLLFLDLGFTSKLPRIEYGDDGSIDLSNFA